MKILVYPSPVDSDETLVAKIPVVAGDILEMPGVFANVRQSLCRREFDENIRLNESDCEEYEESADVIDYIPVHPDMHVSRDDTEWKPHNSEVTGRFVTRNVLRQSCGPTSCKYPRNLESPRVSSPGFGNDSKMMVMRVDVTAQVTPELQRRMRFVFGSYCQKKQMEHSITPVSSATGTTVSRQTVYRRLGHIGLYDRRPVRYVPLSATHWHLRLTWSKEHALWTPKQ
ncbi:HTH_Tnp_Tc3_2 domain-containing protein [Trichonephila clavipes]|nr:HTH_Tnp_Tc3_2 domain-containing protein [Trichonephila clavipes]